MAAAIGTGAAVLGAVVLGTTIATVVAPVANNLTSDLLDVSTKYMNNLSNKLDKKIATARGEQNVEIKQMQVEQMQAEQMQAEQMQAEQMQAEQMQAEQMQAEQTQQYPAETEQRAEKIGGFAGGNYNIILLLLIVLLLIFVIATYGETIYNILPNYVW